MKEGKKKLRLKKKYDRILTNFVIVILLGLLLFSSFKIYEWLRDTSNANKIENDILNKVEINPIVDEGEVTEPSDIQKDSLYWKYKDVALIDVDISKLKEENNETVGWIQVEGTNVNYPVVKANSNDYYLNHDFLKKSNKAGWIFADYRNDLNNLSNNTIIYGHKMKNKSMFGSLSNLLNSSWLNNTDNHIIKLATDNYSYLFQIFSIYTIEDESYYLTTSFASNDKHQEFIDTITGRSRHNFKTSISTNDNILTLSTCHSSSKRLVVHSKLIRAIKKLS